MVEVGELEVIGTLNETGIEQGFNRMQQDFKDLDNLVKQANAQFSVAEKTAKRLGKTFIGLGLAGVAAMTALAVKSPVLAGTMAKIELQTLKLSNTIGRQLRPIFETIAQELLPAINSAFQNSSENIGLMVDKTVKLIEILSDLITLDFTEFKKDLDDLFTPQRPDPISGRTQEQEENIYKSSPLSKFLRGEPAFTNIGLYDPDGPEGPQGLTYTPTPTGGLRKLYDLFDAWLFNNNDKEITFASANGVTR